LWLPWRHFDLQGNNWAARPFHTLPLPVLAYHWTCLWRVVALPLSLIVTCGLQGQAPRSVAANPHTHSAVLLLSSLLCSCVVAPAGAPALAALFSPQHAARHSVFALSHGMCRLISNVTHTAHRQRWLHAGHRGQVWDMEQHAQKDIDPLAAMPPVPPKVTYSAAVGGPLPYEAASRMPAVDPQRVAALSNKSESHRLESDLASAGATGLLGCSTNAWLPILQVHTRNLCFARTTCQEGAPTIADKYAVMRSRG
jgi:hypothetical protein